LFLAFLISRSVASPLRQISEASIHLANGEKTYVKPQGPKEVRRLGEVFNEMSAQVHASQQSQRDFVANVSHELKTPLTSVQGFAQAILDGTAGTPEAQQKAAQVIYDESGRMYRMVLDLLDLAKLDAGTAELVMEVVSLDLLLDAVVERFTPQSAQAQVEIVNNSGSLPAIAGDGDRLAQVFNNLVENAIKHTPAGGKVTLTSVVEEGNVLVHVQDSGPGIPPEEAARIFERFYQLDKARKGGPAHSVGLGLAIASQIVQAHGGEISVKSEIGKGSVFTVRLPVSRQDGETLASKRIKR
jgi:two-component system sensor histidine kinase ResE